MIFVIATLILNALVFTDRAIGGGLRNVRLTSAVLAAASLASAIYLF